MKNIFKVILGVSLAFAMVSCGEDNVGPTFTYNPDDKTTVPVYSFPTPTVQAVGLAADATEVYVDIVRSIATDPVTMTLKVCSDKEMTKAPNGIEVSATEVSFEAGVSKASFKVDITKMEVGSTYTNYVTATVNTLSAACVLKTQKEYTWVDYGTCENTSDFWEETNTLNVQKAEGVSVYRVFDVYGANGGYEDHVDYMFSLASDGTVTMMGESITYANLPFISFTLGFEDFNGYGTVWAYVWPEASAASGIPSGPTFKDGTLIFYALFHVSAGNFGSYGEQFTKFTPALTY